MHITDFKNQTIHFIGIGGISMSGLALILSKNGYRVQGSDINYGAQVERLEQNGIKVFIGHNAENVSEADMIVYTASILADNPELNAAKAKNLPAMDRGTLLGQIMESYTNAIGISGTHGKTTVTSMLATIFELSLLDPTIHIGGNLPLIGGSVKPGKNDYFITEACEYVESFLKLFPTCAVILNIDTDHLDYFRDLEHIKSAFGKFVLRLPDHGIVVANGDDANVNDVLKGRDFISFGLNENNDFTARSITYDDLGCAHFDVYKKGEFLVNVALSVPGKHNCVNALAAIAVADFYGIEAQKISDSLKTFCGAERRFQYIGEINGAKVIHDYAHHPAEIKATLQSAQCIKHNTVWCIFQPHTCARTKALYNEFVDAFNDADKLILTDIYAAREKKDDSVTSQMLADSIAQKGQDVMYIPSFEEIAAFIKANAAPGDLILTLGAGNINGLSAMILKK